MRLSHGNSLSGTSIPDFSTNNQQVSEFSLFYEPGSSHERLKIGRSDGLGDIKYCKRGACSGNSTVQEEENSPFYSFLKVIAIPVSDFWSIETTSEYSNTEHQNIWRFWSYIPQTHEPRFLKNHISLICINSTAAIDTYIRLQPPQPQIRNTMVCRMARVRLGFRISSFSFSCVRHNSSSKLAWRIWVAW